MALTLPFPREPPWERTGPDGRNDRDYERRTEPAEPLRQRCHPAGTRDIDALRTAEQPDRVGLKPGRGVPPRGGLKGGRPAFSAP